jgi:hypothetical protein
VKSKDSSVVIQTSSQSVPSTPSWFGEVTVIAHYLEHLGVLSDISERVRFARRRFGQYDLIDFAVVLLGYAISGERTLEAFYERVLPFANTFMALFGRELYWLLGSSVRERGPLGFHRSHLSGCQVWLSHRNCRGRVLIYQRNHACLGSGP